MCSRSQIELVKRDWSSLSPRDGSAQDLAGAPPATQSSIALAGPSQSQEPLRTSENLGAAAMGATAGSLNMPGMGHGTFPSS